MTYRTFTACFLTAGIAVAPLLAQEKFDSADAAAQAIVEAAGKHDAARLAAILGPDANAILTSGDPGQDRSEQSEFERLFREKHQLEPDARDPRRVILAIGSEDWPFPVPIVRANGKWSFDPSESGVEMHARHIGADELDAIEICAGYVEAQRKYASEDRDKAGILRYASRLMSAPGHHDGLYWEGEGGPLVPRAFAEAAWEGQKAPAKPYHGYYFRILEGQGSNAPGGAHNYLVKDKLIGGFGLVAWPAQYGVSGIHTFIVNQNGVIFQKDVPPLPGAGPSAITRFDPDSSWTPVE
jgi:hypothetical protein